MASPASGPEILQSVQFVAAADRRFAVLDADDWEALIEWLETIEDAAIACHAFTALAAADSDRERAGWQRWDAVQAEHVN